MQAHASWSHLEGLPLADPQYAANDKVELLLGAEICSVILENGLRKSDHKRPSLKKLAWDGSSQEAVDELPPAVTARTNAQ